MKEDAKIAKKNQPGADALVFGICISFLFTAITFGFLQCELSNVLPNYP